MRKRIEAIVLALRAPVCLVSAVALSGVGCFLVAPENCPYQVRDLVFYTGERNGADSQVGVSFKIRNTGSSRVFSGKLSFQLFQNDRPIPDLGRYCVNTDIGLDLDPDQESEVTIALDDLFYFVPVGDVSIRNFYFPSISMSTGTWLDAYLSFKYPYENENEHV